MDKPITNSKKLGVWLLGAYGGVGTTIAVGLSALRRNATTNVGLTTALPKFATLDFCDFANVVVGGHDVRKGSFVDSAMDLNKSSGVFDASLLNACSPDLADWSMNVRPGVVRKSGRPVEAFADWRNDAGEVGDLEIVERLANDLCGFAKQHQLDQVVVVNVSSSEPMAEVGGEHASWSTLEQAMKSQATTLPGSSLYGLAAAGASADYINFTPSLGVSSPALEERCRAAGIAYAGKDGKTGETLMKAVLAPMFARRNLEVMSWVGHNILGNRDGLVLQDPVSKQGKLESKGKLIGEILGYEPQTLISIEHVPSLGDWKTAWDHIHFRGFLGTKMSLQFIWQGCDSLLAAPLAIDLVRWTELARRRGESGCLKHLAAYFKSPMHVAEQDFFRQWDTLEAYAVGSS